MDYYIELILLYGSEEMSLLDLLNNILFNKIFLNFNILFIISFIDMYINGIIIYKCMDKLIYGFMSRN